MAVTGTLMKITLPSGNLAVYDVQPQHVGDPAFIRQYGVHLFTKFAEGWYRLNPLEPVTFEQAATLDAMPPDF